MRKILETSTSASDSNLCQTQTSGMDQTLIRSVMITRDYLKKLGFKQDVRAPKGCEDYFIQIVGNGYVNIRFMQNEPDKVS